MPCCSVTTHNWTISTLQERLVVYVHNCRQQILQNKDTSVTFISYIKQWNLNVITDGKTQTEHVTYRKCFPRASLCNANHILATKRKRPALGLDWRWFCPVLFIDHIHHISWEKGEKPLNTVHHISIMIQLNLALKLTWKAGFVKFCNGIRAFSSLDCNGFGPSVLFHFLLQDLRGKKI